MKEEEIWKKEEGTLGASCGSLPGTGTTQPLYSAFLSNYLQRPQDAGICHRFQARHTVRKRPKPGCFWGMLPCLRVLKTLWGDGIVAAKSYCSEILIFAANPLGRGTFTVHKESSCYIFLPPAKVGLAAFKMLPVSDSDVPLHDTLVLSITRKASICTAWAGSWVEIAF